MSISTLPKLIIIMGVCGSGKTTLATKLAKQHNLILVEADDFHSEEAIALMQSGQPLSDELREPWITRLEQHLRELSQQNRSCVLAYSGLRREHRKRLFNTGFQTFPFLLQADFSTLKQRLEKRSTHFMPVSLLQSQLDALDVPAVEENIVELNIGQVDLQGMIEKIQINCT